MRAPDASELLAALNKFFAGAAQLPPEMRQLSAELTVLAELQKRGLGAEAEFLALRDEGPEMVLKNGLKIAVRTPIMDSPTGLAPDFSVKKSRAIKVDAVVCLGETVETTYIFLRGEIRNLWMDGEVYYDDHSLYFHPWQSEEECAAYCEKTKKGRGRKWGKIFDNKGRIIENCKALLAVDRSNLQGNWRKLGTAIPEPPEKTAEEIENEKPAAPAPAAPAPAPSAGGKEKKKK